MNSLLLSISFFIVFFSSYSQDQGQTIEITVNNAVNSNGKILFALHTAETFMISDGIQGAESAIENGIAKATFYNVKPGTYAVLVLHDENDNNRMDYHENGMPNENYAMSNNPMSYGPPQFTDAKFTVADDDLKFTIRF